MKKILMLLFILMIVITPVMAQNSTYQVLMQTLDQDKKALKFTTDDTVKVSFVDTIHVQTPDTVYTVGLDTSNTIIIRQGQPWEYQVTSGQLPGYSTIDKFGLNPLITTLTDPEDVWEGGGVYEFSDTADIVSFSSSSTADTGIVIMFQGLLNDGTEYIQYDTLNGQNVMTLDSAYWRIYRMSNVDSVSLTGVLYCYSGTTASSGVPSGGSVKKALIDDGHNQTLMAIYTVPLGKVAFLFEGEAGLSFAGGVSAGTQTARLYWQSRRLGGVFTIKKVITLVTAGNSNYQDTRAFPDVVPALTDIKINIAEVTDDIGVWATFDFLLVDESEFDSTYLAAIGQPFSR